MSLERTFPLFDARSAPLPVIFRQLNSLLKSGSRFRSYESFRLRNVDKCPPAWRNRQNACWFFTFDEHVTAVGRVLDDSNVNALQLLCVLFRRCRLRCEMSLLTSWPTHDRRQSRGPGL
jgi:hypothetical protein